MLTTKPRGTNDFIPGEVEQWQALEACVRELFRLYHYKEIRTPIFEHTELFLRSVGETSDIVEKEMYSFEDKAFRHMTLRPEGTAGTVRAFLENKLFAGPLPLKLYYIGPMFRYDQPQAGRYRQFHQFGAEVFGAEGPAIDAEVIVFAIDLFQRLGLKDLSVKLNTVGCAVCRPGYQDALRAYFSTHFDALCPTCQKRLATNPLRILDCKEDACKALSANAPTTIEYACPDCDTHFKSVCDYLNTLDVQYEVDTSLVRGLDYYTQTAFEVVVNTIGSQQNAICGGGRYNGLVADVGGEDIPGIGFAAGMERLLLTLQEQGIVLGDTTGIDVYIASLGERAQSAAFSLLYRLRGDNIACETDYLGKSLKAQMKGADRMNARISLLIGDEELDNQTVILRHMEAGTQETVPMEDIVTRVKEALQNARAEANA